MRCVDLLLRDRQVSASASQYTWTNQVSPVTCRLKMFSCSANLHIEQIQNSLVVKSKNAFENQHMRRVNGSCLLHPRVPGKGVYWDLCSLSEVPISQYSESAFRTGQVRWWHLPSFQISKTLDQDVEVNGIGGVKIIFVFECFLGGFLVQSLVEGIHGENDDPRKIQLRYDGMG